MNDGFWLDEIWSLRFAVEAPSLLGIFTSIHYDNNHYLTTLWMQWLGPSPHWVLYRLPSLFAGLLTVALAIRVGRRLMGEAAGFLCGLMFAIGYPMLHYGTEARGYSIAMLCALYAYELVTDRERSARWRALAFAATAVVGLLGHLTFFFFLAAFWSLMGLQAVFAARRLKPIEWACYLGVPLALEAALYWVDVRHIRIGIGGGERQTAAEIIPSFYGLSFGFPRSGVLFWLGALGLIALLAHGFQSLVRRGRREEAILAALVLPLPLAGLVFLSGPVVAERYLMVSLPFLYLLAACGLADLLQGGRREKAALAAAFAVFCGGSLWWDWNFLSKGRGHYVNAVRYLEREEKAPVIEAASDQPWRNGIVADYYSVFLSPGRSLHVSNQRTRKNPPDWFLAHRLLDSAPEPPAAFTDPLGNRFVLQQRFAKWGLSGFRWFVYRRV